MAGGVKFSYARGTRPLIYCSKAAQEEVARAFSSRRHGILEKRWLGLMPIVDGRCSYCGKPVRSVR